MQMALSIKCGVALVIMPLLTLASNQRSKIKSTSLDAGLVLSYHLDEYHQQDTICTPSVISCFGCGMAHTYVG